MTGPQESICMHCKHCVREEYIPSGHSEYTPELGDWECAKGVFESSGALPYIAACAQYMHDRRGYMVTKRDEEIPEPPKDDTP